MIPILRKQRTFYHVAIILVIIINYQRCQEERERSSYHSGRGGKGRSSHHNGQGGRGKYYTRETMEEEHYEELTTQQTQLFESHQASFQSDEIKSLRAFEQLEIPGRLEWLSLQLGCSEWLAQAHFDKFKRIIASKKLVSQQLDQTCANNYVAKARQSQDSAYILAKTWQVQDLGYEQFLSWKAREVAFCYTSTSMEAGFFHQLTVPLLKERFIHTKIPFLLLPLHIRMSLLLVPFHTNMSLLIFSLLVLS